MPKADHRDTLHFRWLDNTPVGRLLLAMAPAGLRYLLFDSCSGESANSLPAKSNEIWQPDTGQLDETARQLTEWFAGLRTSFDLPLDPFGTEFQHRVWAELREIPWGHTASYGEIARRIGQPTASRAVGMANGRNPISIIVPCHRVIGSSGKLTGFGGGLDRKRTLLQLEGSWPAPVAPRAPALLAELT